MKKITVKELPTTVNKYIVVDYKNDKTVVNVKKVDMKKNMIFYQEFTGNHIGGLFKSRFNTWGWITIFVYNTKKEAIANWKKSPQKNLRCS